MAKLGLDFAFYATGPYAGWVALGREAQDAGYDCLLVHEGQASNHFEGLLGRCGWKIKSGCLHDDRGPLLKREGDVASYVFHQSVWGLAMRQAQIIVLDHRLLDEEPALRMVLLHEMVHAKLMTLGGDRKQRSAHGQRFVQELRRLLGRGEECLRSEVKFYASHIA